MCILDCASFERKEPILNGLLADLGYLFWESIFPITLLERIVDECPNITSSFQIPLLPAINAYPAGSAFRVLLASIPSVQYYRLHGRGGVRNIEDSADIIK